MSPVVRVIDATLSPAGAARLVVSGLDDVASLHGAWASSGAIIQRVGQRLVATSTVRALIRAAGRSLPADEAHRLVAAVERAVSAWKSPSPAVTTARQRIDVSAGLAIMGILNVTPDSFSDGGVLFPRDHPRAAVRAGETMAADGAAILDVGGESTRPGAVAVPVEQEQERVLPVVAQLADAGHTVSIDTRHATTAHAALSAGAAIVNDVSGAADPDLLAVTAEHDAGYVLMHTRATPDVMADHADYDDVVADVYEFLARGVARCVDAGIAEQRIIVDPGIGFAKRAEHSIALLAALRQLRGLGRPVLVGASRKSFIASLDGATQGPGTAPAHRLEGSLAVAALAVAAGVAVLRVHDVAPTARVVATATAITRQPLT